VNEVIFLTVRNSCMFGVVTIRLNSLLERMRSTSLTLIIVNLTIILTSSNFRMGFGALTRNQILESTIDTIVMFVIILTIGNWCGNWVTS
jgi:uncharacterized membrane protein